MLFRQFMKSFYGVLLSPLKIALQWDKLTLIERGKYKYV